MVGRTGWVDEEGKGLYRGRVFQLWRRQADCERPFPGLCHRSAMHLIEAGLADFGGDTDKDHKEPVAKLLRH